MGFAWSHTTYAEWKGIIFNFEWKRDLDYFLEHTMDAKRISAKEAYSLDKEFVRVFASCGLGSNKDRQKRIQDWYDNKRNSI